MYLADSLSRDRVNKPNQEVEDENIITNIIVYFWQRVSNVEGRDKAKDNLQPHIRQYWHLSEELSVDDGIIFKNCKLVVPLNLKDKFLKYINSGHCSYPKCVKNG